MRGNEHERNDDAVEEAEEEEEEEEEEEDDEAAGIPWASTRNASSSSTCAKGSDERLQESQTNAISPPEFTASLYFVRETERVHLTCVHFSQ